MKRYVILYAATAAVMLILDGMWLGFVAKDFYRTRLAHLMAPNFSLPIAALFYLLYVAGVVIFAGAPAAEAGTPVRALILGALFGFFCYATYDLTNAATLRDWPAAVTVVDLLWGTALTGVAAFAGAWVANYFKA